MKKLKLSDLIPVLLCLVMIIPGVLLYDKLPDRIVTGWALRNGPNQTNPKAFVVFGLPLIFAAGLLVCCIYARVLEEKKRAGKMLPILKITFPAVFIFSQGMILLAALEKLKDIRFVICIFASVIMIVFGNYMPKVRKNWVLGIRTPHTLMDEDVWHRTHRLGGIVFMAAGAVMLVTSLLGHFTASFVILMIAVLIPCIYGEVIYYSNKKKKK